MGQKDLPCCGAAPIVKAFERRGWRVATSRQRNPHIVMVKDGERATLTIPNHRGKDVSRALLAKLIKAAGMTEQEFLDAFNRR